jgi:lysozyme
MNRGRLINQLIDDEGLVQFCYPDQFGYHTIGVGRCIDKRKGKGISKEEVMYLLNHDIDDWNDELHRVLPWVNSLDDLRQEVLICMAHQMGVDGLLKFQKFLGYLRAGEYKQAAKEGLISLWARQTPDRAQRMMKMIEEGEK